MNRVVTERLGMSSKALLPADIHIMQRGSKWKAEVYPTQGRMPSCSAQPYMSSMQGELVCNVWTLWGQERPCAG